jgi:hypothetical protein
VRMVHVLFVAQEQSRMLSHVALSLNFKQDSEIKTSGSVTGAATGAAIGVDIGVVSFTQLPSLWAKYPSGQGLMSG